MAQRGDVLLYPSGRVVVGHREAALDVRLHLRAETEVEPSIAGLLDGPRVHRGDHRTARERDGDARAQAKRLRRRGGYGEGEERVDLRLGDPEPVVAVLFASPRVLGGIA